MNRLETGWMSEVRRLPATKPGVYLLCYLKLLLLFFNVKA